MGFLRKHASVLLAALALTLLNAIKPVHVDDPTYISFAKQIAAKPLDPYGFEVFWAGVPTPANHTLAPPVFLYYLAIAIEIFGENPLLWKLWLFPLNVLLAGAIERLARRFAPGLEKPLLVAIVLSSAVLPTENLMLDVPAFALAFLAVAVFLEACDRESMRLALLAGVVVGLATETKYTGSTAGGAILAAALVYRKPRLGIAAVLVSLAFFLAVEIAIKVGYGESHFLANLGLHPQSLGSKIKLLKTLPRLVGGALPFLPMLALTGLRAKPWMTVSAGVVSVAGYVILMMFPGDASEDARELCASGVFLVLGILVLVTLGFSVCKLAKGDEHDRFLIAWLVVEAVGCWALTPFPAIRRVLAFAAVATVLVGRLASRSLDQKLARVFVRVGVAGTVATAFLVYAVDTREAFAQKQIVIDAAREAPTFRVWFLGHWGFEYYAKQIGMMPVEPGRSKLLAGDSLVVPQKKIYQQEIRLEPMNVADAERYVCEDDPLPLTTLPCYYAGKWALEPRSGNRLGLMFYEIRKDFVAQPGPPREER